MSQLEKEPGQAAHAASGHANEMHAMALFR
jgi:hypothetical protein